MYIAKKKRKENIAEYILYLWQLEDLLRALDFNPEAIYSNLVEPQKELSQQEKETVFFWYMDIANLIRTEGKEKHGHLEMTMHLIEDMNRFSLQLCNLPVGVKYREMQEKLSPELEELKSKLGKADMSDIETCFRALYSVMLYHLKGEKNDLQQEILDNISPVISYLADIYGKTERGEIDLFEK